MLNKCPKCGCTKLIVIESSVCDAEFVDGEFVLYPETSSDQCIDHVSCRECGEDLTGNIPQAVPREVYD